MWGVQLVISRAVGVGWPVNIEQKMQVPCCKKKAKAESGVSGIRSRRGQVQRKKGVIV